MFLHSGQWTPRWNQATIATEFSCSYGLPGCAARTPSAPRSHVSSNRPLVTKPLPGSSQKYTGSWQIYLVGQNNVTAHNGGAGGSFYRREAQGIGSLNNLVRTYTRKLLLCAFDEFRAWDNKMTSFAKKSRYRPRTTKNDTW